MNHRLSQECCVTGDRAKIALENLIAGHQATGVLAYQDEHCVGWCAVDPIESLPGHDFYIERPEFIKEKIWSIHCLFVIPAARGTGISTGLVKYAIDLARANGARKLLAFPIPEETHAQFPPHDSEFSGRLSTFLKLGFEKVDRLNEFYQIVELQLD